MAGRGCQPGRGTALCLWAVCLSLGLLWGIGGAEGAVSRHAGPCVHKEVEFQPGQTFYKACQKCLCHDSGYICFSPMKPTSWPHKCQRIPTKCGYKVVYKELPGVECRAYSWVW